MTRLRELLNIELPIIQAPMAGAQGSSLAIAVCEAGGLGSLPAAMLSAQSLRAELAVITQQTRRPYNVNFFCHSEPATDTAQDSRWRAALAPYYAELGVDPASTSAAPARKPFDKAACEVLEEFRPPVVSFHFGLPSDDLLRRVRTWGAKVLATATTLNEALWLESRGVDAIIAQGLEAGGHRGTFLRPTLEGQPATVPLLNELTTSVRVPVIAAGGIGDAPGVAQMLERGAVAAQIGTAYLLCPEATTSAVHRQALKSETARTTAITNLFTGRPGRGIVNRLMRELGPMSDLPPRFPLAANAIAPLRAAAESRGNGDFSPLWAGQGANACREIGAAELTRELSGF